MMKLRKFTAIALILLLALSALSACAPKDAVEAKGGISIVSTVFPSYDFARQITAGTDAEVTLLLQPGEEVHSFDPTSQDIIRVQNADLFLYVGGENDTWVNGVLSGLDKSVNTFRMMDYVTLYEEELGEGMQPEEEEAAAAEATAEKEWDEHVWTAPVNAISIVKAMTAELVKINPANAKTYQANSDAYVAQLEALDQSFWDVVNTSARKTVVFADRFPVRYFVEEFGLNYYAAFPGCSAETEASAATIASLIDHVKSENIPVVFYIEMSNQQMADTVAEATGAKTMLFHTCHNVTKAEFESGATYLSLMQNNVLALKAALN
ncbi:MAG: metal ABC transporter substrate-binding protein [Eubacteriales bacterium]|nr:metal ABC transporter substrate-binding protein [Eubacteriales bacterium]